MGLNIKKPGVEAKIRKLAARTGESLTDAIDNAVEEKLARLEQEDAALQPAKSLKEFEEAMKPFWDELAERRRRTGKTFTSQELMDDLYDENGLPK